MKPYLKDITDQIVSSKVPLEKKIVQLFAVVMTNYREPLGDRAWDQMRAIAGAEQVGAIAFLTGLVMGEHGPIKADLWARMLPADKTKSWEPTPKKPPTKPRPQFR